MSVALYMDEHVKSAVTKGLRRRGVDVLTVQEDNMDGQPDSMVLDRALVLGRVVFTRDEDFLAEGSRRQNSTEAFAGVIYSHQQGLGIGACISELELIAGASNLEDWVQRVAYLPL